MYTPEANGRLEAWHCFFKACVAKHIRGNAAEWDKVIPLAAAAYNFFPVKPQENPHLCSCLGGTQLHHLPKLLEPAPQYWGDHGGYLKMDLRKPYLLTAENVKRAREGRDPAETTAQKSDLKINDLVLVRNVTSGAFAPRYSPNYRIVAIHGPNRIVVRDEKGNESVRRTSHLKTYNAKEKMAAMVPEQDEYSTFGQSTKLLLHPKDVPDLQFTSKTEEKGEILPSTEVSVMELNLASSKQETERCSDWIEKYGEIPPNAEDSRVKYLVEKCGEIWPKLEICVEK